MNELLQQAREALKIGRDSAAAEADAYHQSMRGFKTHRHKAMDDDVATIDAAIAALDAALAEPPAGAPDTLPCGHPASLLLRSAETGQPLYCELCDAKSGRRDAEQMEQTLQELLIAWRDVAIASGDWLPDAHGFPKRTASSLATPAAQAAPQPTPTGAGAFTAEWAADMLGIPRQELSVAEFSDYQQSRIATFLRGAQAGRNATTPTGEQAIPKGFRLVPVEPTPQMVSAGVSRVLDNQSGEAWEDCFDGVWRAMLAAAPPTPSPQPMSEAARDVLAERHRQVEVEGWTTQHDDAHDAGDIAAAASAYALAAADKLNPMSQGDGDFDKVPPSMWLWDRGWWKPGEPRRNLVKAGALILAEIERLDRAGRDEPEGEGR